MTVDVFTVHTILDDEIRPTQAVFGDEALAHTYAAQLSTDEEVLAAGVVRFTVGKLGSRTTTALYVDGVRQQVPYVSDTLTVFNSGRKRS